MSRVLFGHYLWHAGLEFIRGDLRQYAGCAERIAYDGGSLSTSRQYSIVFTRVIQVHFAAALRRTLDNSACCPPNRTPAAHAGARAVWVLPDQGCDLGSAARGAGDSVKPGVERSGTPGTADRKTAARDSGRQPRTR